jgi:hypothetical protein
VGRLAPRQERQIKWSSNPFLLVVLGELGVLAVNDLAFLYH